MTTKNLCKPERKMHLLVWLFVYPKKLLFRTDFPAQFTKRIFNSKGEQLWNIFIVDYADQ